MRGIIKRIRMLGPGLMFAALGVGMTHVVLLPAAGAYWGFSLLWVMLLAFVFTYPYYEFGIRYICATEKSIFSALNAYIAGGRRRGWIMWFVLLGVIIIAPLSFSAFLAILASTTVSAIPGFPGGYNGAAVTWSGLVLLPVLLGRYRGLELLSKLFTAILVAVFTTTFFLKLPEPGAVIAGLVPRLLPAASLSFLVPMMALPNGPADVAYMSSWILQKKELLAVDAESAASRARLLCRRVLFDFRLAWAFLFIIGLFILSLAATILYPGEVPVGVETMLIISNIFTRSMGAWILPVFLVGVIAAIWSTSTFAVDGVSRMVGAGFNHWRGREEEAAHFSPLRLIAMFWMVGSGLAFSTILQEPVVLVIVAYASYLVMFPMGYLLNIWAATRLIPHEELRPPKFLVLLARIGLIWVTLGMALTAYIYFTGLQVY